MHLRSPDSQNLDKELITTSDYTTQVIRGVVSARSLCTAVHLGSTLPARAQQMPLRRSLSAHLSAEERLAILLLSATMSIVSDTELAAIECIW